MIDIRTGIQNNRKQFMAFSIKGKGAQAKVSKNTALFSVSLKWKMGPDFLGA